MAVEDIQRDIARLCAMADDLRSMRYRLCETKANTNPRYHTFSAAVSNIDKLVADLQVEAAGE